MIYTQQTNKWRKWFAIFPVCLPRRDCRVCVWLQWYWSRPDGDSIETSFTDPALTASRKGG